MKYEGIHQPTKAEGIKILQSPEQKKIEKNLRKDILALLKNPEYKVGEGATAQVYYPKKGDSRVAYKIYHREAMAYAKNESDVPEEFRHLWQGNREQLDIPWRNSGKREMEITDKLNGIDDDVRVPLMYMHQEMEGEEQGDSYWVKDDVEVLVMERLGRAVDLEQLVMKKHKLPQGFNPDTFCDKLQIFFKKMHELGIYHRDVAPRNIMIDLETGRPYVIDFGRATDLVLSSEDPYDQQVYHKGESTTLKILSSDEKGVESIREHLKNYAEYLNNEQKKAA